MSFVSSVRACAGTLASWSWPRSPQQQLEILAVLPQSCCLVSQTGWRSCANTGPAVAARRPTISARAEHFVRRRVTTCRSVAPRMPPKRPGKPATFGRDCRKTGKAPRVTAGNSTARRSLESRAAQQLRSHGHDDCGQRHEDSAHGGSQDCRQLRCDRIEDNFCRMGFRGSRITIAPRIFQVTGHRSRRERLRIRLLYTSVHAEETGGTEGTA